MNEHRQYDTDGCCICPSIDGHSYCYECGCPDPRPGIKATCGCTCQCHEQEHPMTEQNPTCANCHQVIVAEEGDTCASIPVWQRGQFDYCDQTVPDHAPEGMLAVRVGSDPWTMVPLDNETDAPCALHGDAECDWGCPHPYANPIGWDVINTSTEETNDMTTTRRTDAAILDGLWEITLDGFHDAECGSVDENGYWYGLIRFSTEADELGLPGMAGAIVETDSYGFKGYNAYETVDALDAAWADCETSAAGEDTEDSYYS